MKTEVINREDGFALIAVLMLIAIMTAILGAYVAITKIELATARSSQDTASGFYAAEGGLNVRAAQIRDSFVGYNIPSGSSPSDTNPCEGANNGSGLFGCSTNSISNRNVSTYVKDHQAGANPSMIKIPQGELFQNLWAQEYRYTASSIAKGRDGKTEALLQLRFKSRLVPLFQFAAFFNKDLEILPGPNMLLTGPVHANGDLYLNSENTLSMNSQVSASGTIYRGRKNTSACNGTVRAMDPASYRTLVSGCSSRVATTNAMLTPYNGMLKQRVESVTVPEPSALDSAPGALYWDRADLRIVLNLNASSNLDTSASSHPIRVYNQNNTINQTQTNQLNGCSGGIRWTPPSSSASNRVVGSSYAFRNIRENNKTIRMLDVDMLGLFACLHTTNWLGTGRSLNDSTDGGLVLHFTVRGPNQNSAANEYGVRLANGEELKGPSGAPAIRGVTVVTDQAVFVTGHYNRLNKKPASVLADSFNVLSHSWYDAGTRSFTDNLSTQALGNRTPADTTHNIAVLAGSDTTANIEGSGGQNHDQYSGGLENFPRFHENWNGNRTYTYRGSWVSLNRPRHVNGDWGQGNVYSAPARNWDYDTSFNNAANLPPLSPRFVYLKQELFVRDFER